MYGIVIKHKTRKLFEYLKSFLKIQVWKQLAGLHVPKNRFFSSSFRAVLFFFC